MHGGDNRTMISRVAGAIEGAHAYLLVVDDIADHALTRRGKPTAHITLRDFLSQQSAHGNIAQTAANMAISAALAAEHKVQGVFNRLDVSTERKIHALTALNDHLAHTNRAQVLDIASTTGAPMSLKDITLVARSKTAYYSFQMPLEIGALLAGASDQSLQRLSDYSLHAGLAFQLQDDIMGTFGNEQDMGKSAKSDLVEGKQTLLLAYATEAASDTQLQILRSSVGNSDLSDADFARCQEIIVATGALAKVRAYAQREVAAAHKILDASPIEWPSKQVAFLRDLATFTVTRNN
jgi:geranylgeranyl pyrophosphate synthase